MAAPALRPTPPPFLGYGRQLIEEDDIAAVVAALHSPHLAHGPRVDAFELALAQACGSREAVACSSGTGALQLALASLDVGPGHVCVVPAVTFLSTATAARLLGAEVRFTDVDPDTGLMTAETLAAALDRSGPVKAILPVHLAGRLCDMTPISALAREVGATVVEDACHALGGLDEAGQPVGACRQSDAACFSFHPVKTIAAGEGGAVTLNDAGRAARARRLRNHGVTRDAALMGEPGSFGPEGRPNPWAYEQLELGFNLRLDEMSAALGMSQLAKLRRLVELRASLAAAYDAALAPLGPRVRAVPRPLGARWGLHLYTVLLDEPDLAARRGSIIAALASDGIGAQVHYVPLYRQPYFRERYGPMRLAGAEAYYGRVLALPLHPSMHGSDVDRVAEALAAAIEG
ncbi:aminotransferase class I/II-fold pyridoxal phosphate-dependent enzyme [Caulobacter sp. S45]|uniref:aminotransferase class I/II-fold pyridoxal phosphate-dependent enzyme n=1 Tax=Caulobacter sp. S45 TaxID=1641861 RepID=UPI001576B9B9|nr:aminotransferase class I/II-fold pyridoxal phosphate-dependent enzyme [Caulobacter sp. S45]